MREISLSTRRWVSGPKPVLPRLSPLTYTGPNSELMPHCVTMCRARLVACCRSLVTPVVVCGAPPQAHKPLGREAPLT